MDELRVIGLFKDLSALLCLRYAMDRAALGFYTHGSMAWPQDPFTADLFVYRTPFVQYTGPALTADEFVIDPPAKPLP